jgi:hypothetical protein
MCCTGCLGGDGGTECQSGNTQGACGSNGVACASCTNSCLLDGGAHCSGCTPSCAGKVCGSDGCGGSCGACPNGQTCSPNGTCACNGTVPERGDALCSNGADDDCNNAIDCQDAKCAFSRCAGMASGRFCDGNLNCTTGCRISATMIVTPGMLNPLNSCQSCAPAIDDSGWSNLPDGQQCTDSTANMTGTCHGGRCCSGCVDNTGLCVAADWQHCGTQGGLCTDCSASPGGCGTCNKGSCAQLAPEGGACTEPVCSNNCGLACLQIGDPCTVQTVCMGSACVPKILTCCGGLKGCTNGACGR